MNMGNKIYIITVMLLTTTFMYAQNRPDKEKIKALKVAFITERLNLTSNEAEVFWPIYNKHEEHIESLRQKERIQIRSRLKDMETLSEEEAHSLLDQYISLEEERNKTKRVFIDKIGKVISAKKVILLIHAEENFKRRLIQLYRQKHKRNK